MSVNIISSKRIPSLLLLHHRHEINRPFEDLVGLQTLLWHYIGGDRSHRATTSSSLLRYLCQELALAFQKC